MTCIDYTFYRINNFYKKNKIDAVIPEFYAMGALMTCFVFNLSSIILWILRFSINKRINILRYESAIVGVFLILVYVVGYFLFIRNRKIEKIGKRWEEEPYKLRLVRGLLILLYISFSLFFLIFSAISFGKFNNSLS